MLPAIHDITTDTDDPPLMVELLKHRAGARNPADYDGAGVAAKQRKAYPDIQPLVLPLPPAEAFALAVATVREMNWEMLEAEAPDPLIDENAPSWEGRIEAIARTPLLRFKDDIVIRLRLAESGGTRIDMRSKSRIGKHDLGANAKRIRAFLNRLKAPR